jgi:hypothetical protein
VRAEPAKGIIHFEFVPPATSVPGQPVDVEIFGSMKNRPRARIETQMTFVDYSIKELIDISTLSSDLGTFFLGRKRDITKLPSL